MRLPNFLIVGAMKAGSSTLSSYLDQHDSVYMSAKKEPEILCGSRYMGLSMGEAYDAMFKYAGGGQICGEASTAYSKAPVELGVPQKAKAILGLKLKIIYIIREPFERTRSHYEHMYLTGKTTATFEEALLNYTELINFSRYWTQVSKWLEYFEKKNIHIVLFEDLVKNPQSVLDQVAQFLGIPNFEILSTEIAANQTGELRVISGYMQKLLFSDAYQYRVKQIVPYAFRHYLKEKLTRRIERPNTEISVDLRHDLDVQFAAERAPFLSYFGLWPEQR
jgi:hypothetical protein